MPSRRAILPVRGFLLCAAATALLCSACGGSGHTATSAATRAATHGVAAAHGAVATRPRPRPASVRVTYRPLYALPAPLRDPAFAALAGGRFVMLGGLDAADVSSAGVEVADLHGVRDTSALPGPQHDAQAAALDGRVYVFGGGDATELDHILRYDPTSGGVSQVGALLAPQSDVAVAASDGTAYVVGGFDGSNYLDTVVAWRPGSAPRVEAHLPVGLRYAAVAVADGGLVVIGGSTPAAASDAIYRFDLTTHQVRRIGTLPHPITHGDAAVLGSSVYLVGGRGDLLNAQTSDVWAINPVTGRVRGAGRLPQPTSDAAVATIGARIVVAGGQSPTSTLAGVGELVPVAAS
ncbi:MAG TPA: kelch repeat-containing protein [Solirubrobacteraceae bacterium]|nr:kelch repeat-containing protein [Solirubrobacteraceae bacterium]